MSNLKDLGGSYRFAGTELTVHRMGYGAMQLAGPHVFGPPRDRDAAIAVLREAVAAGVNHIDTSDFYGPHVTNQIIREALHPYPENLVLVTKIGARRDEKGAWLPALAPAEIRSGIEDNLRNLGREQMDVVNLRVRGSGPLGQIPTTESIEEPLTALLELQHEGLIRHIGLSNVSREQYAEARKLTTVACVQNFYNVAQRGDDAFLDELAADSVPYVPYFPLGGFSRLQSAELDEVAQQVGATPMQVALAWLLHRSPNILLIPGTSSVAHLRENLQAASLKLESETLAQLDRIAATPAAQ